MEGSPQELFSVSSQGADFNASPSFAGSVVGSPRGQRAR